MPPLLLLPPRAVRYCSWTKVRVTQSPPHSRRQTTYQVLSPESGDEGENNAEGNNGTTESVGTVGRLTSWFILVSLTRFVLFIQPQGPWRLSPIWIRRICIAACCMHLRSDPSFSGPMLEPLTRTVRPCHLRNLAMFFAPVLLCRQMSRCASVYSSINPPPLLTSSLSFCISSGEGKSNTFQLYMCGLRALGDAYENMPQERRASPGLALPNPGKRKAADALFGNAPVKRRLFCQPTAVGSLPCCPSRHEILMCPFCRSADVV